MALQLGRALSRGVRRSVSVSGLVVLGLTVLYQVALVTSLNTLILNQLPDRIQPREAGLSSLTLPLSTDAAIVVTVVSLLIGFGVFLVAARLLSRDPAELSTLPAEVFTRRMGRAFLSAAAVSLVLGVVLPLGFALFLVPGLFLAVSFQFAIFAVAVEDEGPLDAFRRSWELARGNRWRLLGLVVLLGVVGGIAGAAGSLFSLASPLVGQLVSLAANSVFLVLTYGILADAFLQLREEPLLGRGGGHSGTPDVEAL